MKKILIFESDKIAYQSTKVFARALGSYLVCLGALVDFFELKKENFKQLEELPLKHYDCIIDFNSSLPGVILDDNTYYLDAFHAPFYDYILDHPIYHHNHLIHKLNDYHVICVDEDHSTYIKKYYQHIRSVTVCPVGAITVDEKVPRDIELLFCGTYLNPIDYLEIIENLPDTLRTPIKKIIEILEENQQFTYEQAVHRMLTEKNDSLSDFSDNFEEFATQAQQYFLADIYIRAVTRDKVLKELARTGIQMAVMGENYDKSSLSQFSNVNIMPQVNFMDSLSYMRRSKIVLNVMPWFKAGIHDRVINAMVNGAVCLSDSSRLMNQYFYKEEDYLQYEIVNLESISLVIEKYRTGKYDIDRIAKNGQNKAKSLTFETIAAQILRSI